MNMKITTAHILTQTNAAFGSGQAVKLCQKRRIYGNLSAAQKYFLSCITVVAFFLVWQVL